MFFPVPLIKYSFAPSFLKGKNDREALYQPLGTPATWQAVEMKKIPIPAPEGQNIASILPFQFSPLFN
jgi:hypothetical protein